MPQTPAGHDPGSRQRPGMPPMPAVRELGVTDLLLFQHTHARSHLLIGGLGAGAEWAGTVAVEERDEPRLVAALDGQVVRIEAPSPTRIIGPYYAAQAALLALDDAVVVLAGSPGWLRDVPDARLQEAGLEASSVLLGTEPGRDLVNEIALYQRLRLLLTPTGDRQATAQHLVEEAARLLEAEFAVLQPEPGADLFVARPGWSPPGDLTEVMGLVAAALPEEVLVIQDAADAALPSPLAPEDGLVSLMVVPLTSAGILLAAHSIGRPRGFTSLDVDIGTLLAEVASVALAAADTTSTLERHVERLRWALSRDPLTGLPDLRAWEEALDATSRGSVVVVGMGHEAVPDNLLQVVGAVLQRQATDTDLAARTDDGEFGLLLRDCDLGTAAEVADALRGRLGDIPRADGSPIAVGHAAAPPLETVRDAWRVAAGRMLQS